MLFQHGTLKLTALALLALPAGCAAPYTYHGDGACGPVSLSGRLVDPGSCAECAASGGPVAVDAGAVPGPGELVKRTLTCNAGCGEIYWGEWINDPPDKCDACNDHGDWMGPHCCPPGIWAGLGAALLAGVHGQRSGGAGNCAQCADDWAGDSSQGVQIDGLAIDIPPPSEPAPAPSATPAPSLAPPPTTQTPAHVAEVPPAKRHPQSRLVRRVRR